MRRRNQNKTDRKNKAGNNRRWLAILLLAAGCLLLTACGASTQEIEQVEEKEASRPQIGMSFDSFVIERWLRDRDQFELTARDLGADVNVQVANGDVKEQISQIRYFIKKKMDVIVIIAVDGASLQEVVSEAKKEGIRVISYDRLLLQSDTDLYVSFDNEMVGTLMGEALKEALPAGGNIFAIYGSPTDYNVTMVKKGFFESIRDSNLNVSYAASCDNWLAELAFDAVEEGISTTPRNLVGVMCGNDDLASQAFRALAENRLAGKVVLVGQDADLSACQRIMEGTQTMTVYKSVEQLAQTSAEFAAGLAYAKLLEEGRISEDEIPQLAKDRMEELKELDTINDAGVSKPYPDDPKDYFAMEDELASAQEKVYEVPYYTIPPVAVTAENMDEVIIDSDFHTREDVYRNVMEIKLDSSGNVETTTGQN